MTGLTPGDLITHLGSTVDAVMTRSVLMYVPDKATAFRAMDRVLSAGPAHSRRLSHSATQPIAAALRRRNSAELCLRPQPSPVGRRMQSHA